MSISYQEQELPLQAVKPRGMLAERMALSLKKLARDEEKACEYIGWGADQIGRWVGAMAVLSELLDVENQGVVKARINELVECQDEAGLFFAGKLEGCDDWDVRRRTLFGQGRAIWNLLDYYRLTGDEAVKGIVVKAADYVVSDRDNWKVSNPLCCGIESVLGAMVALSEMTGQSRYLDYAKWLADSTDPQVAFPSELVQACIPVTELKTVDVPHGHHSHSYLSLTQGLVDLAVATRDESHFDRAKKVFDDTLPSMWLTGGIPEGYGELYERDDETCSVVDWIMLALKLFRVTGESRYLDVAEHCFLNHLLFDQDDKAGFATLRTVARENWIDEKNWGIIADFCCTMHGAWLFSKMAQNVVTSNSRGISVNLALAVDGEVQVNGCKVDVSQSVSVESREIVQTIVINNPGCASLTSRIRVPRWCRSPQLFVNGQARSAEPVAGFVKVACRGVGRTEITLRLSMRLEVIPPRRSVFALEGDGAPGKAAEEGLQYGPFVLMLNREMCKDMAQKDIDLAIPLDSDGNAHVTQDVPAEWSGRGAVPLLISSVIPSRESVYLTPCANLSMTPFTVPDPYVLRFSRIRIEH